MQWITSRQNQSIFGNWGKTVMLYSVFNLFFKLDFYNFTAPGIMEYAVLMFKSMKSCIICEILSIEVTDMNRHVSEWILE